MSDCVSNSLRVVKTYRQVNDKQVSYCEIYSIQSLGVRIAVLIIISWCSETRGHRGRTCGPVCPWPSNSNPLQRPARDTFFHFMEALLRHVSPYEILIIIYRISCRLTTYQARASQRRQCAAVAPPHLSTVSRTFFSTGESNANGGITVVCQWYWVCDTGRRWRLR